MFNEILVKLVIMGLNPANGEFSIVLDDSGAIPHTKTTPQELASHYINISSEWYSIRKQTFVAFEQSLFLIYSVCIPQNIKLKAGKWASMNEVSELKLADKQVVVEGAKL